MDVKPSRASCRIGGCRIARHWRRRFQAKRQTFLPNGTAGNGDFTARKTVNCRRELARSAVGRLALKGGALKAVHVSGPDVKRLREEIGEDLRR